MHINIRIFNHLLYKISIYDIKAELMEYSPGWSTNYNDCVYMYWFAIESKETIIKQLNEL